jgi:membrane fusion protein (multidrug efflux system)
MKKNKFVIPAIIIGSVLVVLFVLIGLRKIIQSKNTQDTFYTVKKETYENIIEIAGTAKAANEQSLQALADGTVVGVYVKAGDAVKEGDLIVQLDDTTEQYNLAKHDYDMATTRISGSKREIELMETQRKSLVRKVRDRKILATFDGVIADLDVATGDSLEAKDVIGTLVDKSYLIADVEVAETDVENLKVGQKTIFTFPAYSKGSVEGYVVSWPAIGTVTSRGATVVEARVRIDNPPSEILPYFSFTGKIEISESQSYLIVERLAVGRENKQAFVQKKDSTQKINVQVEPYGSDYVKILSGVDEGDVLKAQSSSKSSGFGTKGNRGVMGGPGAGGPPPSGSAPKGF